jgi:hypothetical protein
VIRSFEEWFINTVYCLLDQSSFTIRVGDDLPSFLFPFFITTDVVN